MSSSMFTKLLGLLGAFWVAQAMAAASDLSVTGPNLLRDGGFEGAAAAVSPCPGVRGQLPSAWADNSCWNASAQVSYGLDEGQFKGGARSLKVTLSQGLFQLVQPITLQADWQYGVGIWLRSETPMMVKLALRKEGPPYLEYGSRYLRTSTQWTYVSVSAFTNGLSEAEARQAMFIVSSATPGTVWMDNAALAGGRSQLVLPGEPVPAQYFGAHALHQHNARTAFEDGLVGSLRIWDSERSQWHTIQPARPKAGKRNYDWSALDDRVTEARNHRADLLMVLGGYVPSWTTLDEGDPDDWVRNALDCYRCDESPKRSGDWKTWVTDIASRYKGGPIKYWEIWNEPAFGPKDEWCPDQQGCSSKMASMYRGTPAQLLALQNDAAAIIKRLDPSARIVSAGISLYHRDYLDYFLKIGGGKTADVIGYHWYVDGPPELLMPHILAVRGLMRDHGVSDKPLWNTEGGVAQLSLEADPAWRDAKASGQELPRSRELGPAYLARSLIVGWASGLGRWYHYAWDGSHGWPSSTSVIAKGSNLAIDVTEAGVAYRQVVTWMVGKRVVAFETGQGGGFWQATLLDADGQRSYIVWHPARTPLYPANLKKPGAVRKVCDLSGKCRELGAESAVVPVDFRPLYLTP